MNTPLNAPLERLFGGALSERDANGWTSLPTEPPPTDEPVDLRDEVAEIHGIPEAHRHRLSGETREELELDARELSALLKPIAPTGPTEDRSQGSGTPINTTPSLDERLRAAAFRARR